MKQVQVIGPHTHEGKEIPLGEIIEVSDDQAQMMIDAQTGRLATAADRAAEKRVIKEEKAAEAADQARQESEQAGNMSASLKAKPS